MLNEKIKFKNNSINCIDTIFDCDTDISNLNYNSNNILRNFDLSKNKCRLDMNNNLLEVMRNIDLDMLDITQNVAADEPELKKLKEIVIESDSKIIF